MPYSDKKKLIISFSIITLVLITCFDFISGGRYAFSVFYVIPVAILSWYIGKRYSVPTAVFIGFIEAFIKFKDFSDSSSLYYYYLNTAISCVTFTAISFAITKCKSIFLNEKTLARVDFLTGIPNWKSFTECVDREIERAKREKQTLSIAYIDCDNFKSINDEYGHDEGNKALQIIAKSMKRNIRKIDYVARVGGDEFVMLLVGANAKNAYAIMDKVKKVLNFEMKSNNYAVTFSVGLSTFEHVPSSAEEMIKVSDFLMYEVKNTSKDSIKSEVVPKEPVFALI